LKKLKKLLRPCAEFGLGTVLGMAQKKILGNSLTVFCYHDVSNNPSEFSRENSLNVPPDIFNFQIAHIKKSFNVIEPKQLLDQSLPSNAALVTFDDGFKSFFNNAVPILEEHKVPAIIFLNMGPIRGEIYWSGLIVYLCKRRPKFVEYLKTKLKFEEDKTSLFLSCSRRLVEKYLEHNNEDFHEEVSYYVGQFANEKDLECFSTNSYVYYGNHSYTHYVSGLMKDSELLEDIEKNTKYLRKYGNYLDFFAFPFGQPESTFTESQVSLLLKEGIKKVFYSSASSLNTLPLKPLLDRIPLSSDDVSSAKIKYKVMKAWVLSTHNFLKSLL
jgi:hypothetical protein